MSELQRPGDGPDDAADLGPGEPGGGPRRAASGRRVALVACGLLLVVLGATSLFVPLGPSSAANGGIIMFVPLGPSSSAISVWEAHDLCSAHGVSPSSSSSGSWAGPCSDVAPVWGASLLAVATGLVLLMASVLA
jgi:hypothetical protein